MKKDITPYILFYWWFCYRDRKRNKIPKFRKLW